jgi:cation-transporting ATPase 13A1
MITGDNALTACHIAKQVEIVKRPVLIADVYDDELIWKTIDEKISIPINVNNPELPLQVCKYDLCCTGSALTLLAPTPLFHSLLPRLWVYARVSPSQKELVLMRLKSAGYCTLMCGDGTNDVGALKQAHVGIALLDGTVEDVEKIAQRQMTLRKKMILEKQEELRKKWNLPDPNNPNPRPGQVPPVSVAMEQIMSELETEVPTIKFGDASVAAPFTSKISSVMSVCGIIRQGRATLVALTQMYKILALNSLTMAYSLSVLHLAGIKQGDWQATVAGMMLTVCFFGLAKSTAVEKLSPERPQPNIFNFYLILSVLGQSAIHVASLIYIRSEALYYSEEM